MSDQGSPVTPRTEAIEVVVNHCYAYHACHEHGFADYLAAAREDAAATGLREALRNLPPATCYRTHTQPDEAKGVLGAVWLADVQRALAAAPAAAADARRLDVDHLERIIRPVKYRDAFNATQIGWNMAVDEVLATLRRLLPATADTEGAVREAINDPIDGYDAFLDRQDMAR